MYLRYQGFPVIFCQNLYFPRPGQVLVVPPAGFSTTYGLILRVFSTFLGDSQCFLPLWTPQFYGTDWDQGRNGIAVGSYFDIASTLDTVCKYRFMAKSVTVGVIGYPGSSELHTFFHVLVSKIVGRPREVINDQAPPHCSIPHLVELGAFSLSPTSPSTQKLDIHWSWQGMNR